MKTVQEATIWALSKQGQTLPWGGFSQCVAFARNYVDFLCYKQPPLVPGAKNLWTADWGAQFTKCKTPQPGDIGILGPTPINPDGHINVVVEVRPGGIATIDQNLVNPILGGTKGSPITRALWAYPNEKFLGFIRPKFKEEESVSEITDTQIDDTINRMRLLANVPDEQLKALLKDQRPLLRNNYVEGVLTVLDNYIKISTHSAYQAEAEKFRLVKQWIKE